MVLLLSVAVSIIVEQVLHNYHTNTKSYFRKNAQNVNKVIRPKSRASALSKTVRQTDRQTIFFQKHISNSYLLLQASSPLFRDMKNAIKSL